MARVKNTERAEARRRYRSTVAAQRAQEQAGTETRDADERPTVVTEERSQGRPALRLPDLRADLAALPAMFRQRRLLWLPVVLMVAALALYLVPLAGDAGAMVRNIAVVILQPPALIPIFIGGFVAPRASYLVGALLGVIDGILFPLMVVSTPGAGQVDLGAAIATFFPLAVLSGAAMGWFAAWYRDFLRSSAQRRRAAQEARARAQRREQKRPARQAR